MGYKVPCSGPIKNASMNHPPTEETHDHGITRAHPVSQSTTTDNVLIQPHASMKAVASSET